MGQHEKMLAEGPRVAPEAANAGQPVVPARRTLPTWRWILPYAIMALAVGLGIAGYGEFSGAVFLVAVLALSAFRRLKGTRR